MSKKKMSNQAQQDNFKEVYRVPTDEVGMKYYQPAIYADGEAIRICVGGDCAALPINEILDLMWDR